MTDCLTMKHELGSWNTQKNKVITLKKFEFSKLIMVISSVVAIAITLFAMVMVWRTENLEPLVYLIPAVFAELATATGFYYSKAKKENEIKLRKQYGSEIYNDVKGEL